MVYVLWKVRNEFAICLVFCLIVSIISLIYYFTAVEVLYFVRNVQNYELLKLETLWKNDPVYFNATWVSDDEVLTQDASGNIVLFNVNENVKSILAYNTMKHMKHCTKYTMSADKKYLLIAYDFDEDSGKWPTGQYDVINIKTGKQVTLRDKKRKPRGIMFAKWSPINSSLAIVDGFNIYYIPKASTPNVVQQITFDGSTDLFNGISDWTYAEEIFGSPVAMWFSDGGTKLAYVTFDEKLVPSTCFKEFGVPDTMYDQHSTVFHHHYPKVGDANPTVQLFVRNLYVKKDATPIPIKPVKHYTNEIIVYKVTWSGDDNLFVMWMNRIQNESHFVHYRIFNDKVEATKLMEFHQENGWLDFRESLIFGPDNQIALIYPTEHNDGDSYRHINVIQKDGKLRAITNGKIEVTKLIKWDFKSNSIFYLANVESHPQQQHVYRVQIDLKQKLAMAMCLTCDSGCAFNDAVLSEESTYYTHICKESNNVPYVLIMKTDTNGLIKSWETNKKLQKELCNVRLPKVSFLTVPLVDGYEANVKLLIPPNVDISSKKKYPLLIYTNGGPINNVALDEFDLDLNTYLSVNHDIIVAKVDGRGTGRRGCKTLYANYKRLGTGEVDDQIIVAKFLQNKLPYVDDRKTGIWGWSYGGYVAAMVMAKDTENVFRYACSVAPITDWIYYDSMYTERYMGMYKENFQGYRNVSLIENVDRLRGKEFMIVHGLLDRNVLFQHSAMLSKELQRKAILFKQQVFFYDAYDAF